jgi:hypothetical protein
MEKPFKFDPPRSQCNVTVLLGTNAQIISFRAHSTSQTDGLLSYTALAEVTD